MVSQCTLGLISWKVLLKTSCPNCLIRYDTIRWWADLNDSCGFRPYLNTNLVAKLVTHCINFCEFLMRIQNMEK